MGSGPRNVKVCTRSRGGEERQQTRSCQIPLSGLFLSEEKMAKIWKGHRGGSTRGYNDECLKEEAAAERGELKTSAAEFGQLKTSTAEFGRLKTSAAEMGQLKTSAAESRQLKTSLAEHGHLEASATERRQLKTSTAEFRQLKTSGTGFSSSFKSATLLQSHHCKSQSEDDYESDQPLDLSSSKSNLALFSRGGWWRGVRRERQQRLKQQSISTQ